MKVAMRTILRAFTMFEDPKELQNFVQNINAETAFDLDYSNLTDQQLFSVVYSLTTNEADRSFLDLFSHSSICAIAWHLLSNYTDLPLLLKTKEIEDFFLNTFFRIYQASIINAHYFSNAFAGIFPLCSLLNHSCAANVQRLSTDRMNVVVVKRVIKAGEQIFDCYVQSHRELPKAERQKKLESQYNFECQCEACVSNYPLLEDLPVGVPFFQQISNEQIRIKNNDKEFARKKLKKYSSFLKDNHKKYNSFEVGATEANFMESLGMLLSDTPLEELLKPVKNKASNRR